MKGRLMLAALDWNMQIGKPTMTTTKVDVVYSKKRKDFVLKQRFEKDEDLHVPTLMQRIFELQAKKIVLTAMKRPALSCYVAPVPKPSVEQLLAKHKTSFEKNKMNIYACIINI